MSRWFSDELTFCLIDSKPVGVKATGIKLTARQHATFINRANGLQINYVNLVFKYFDCDMNTVCL